MLSIEPLNDRISATSVTISNTIRRRPDSHGRQHRRLRGLSNNRTVMQARRTVRETTGSSVGWSAIVVVFSATARAMPARLMSMSMPVAGDGVVAGGRSGVVVRPAGTGGRGTDSGVRLDVGPVPSRSGAIKVVGFQHLRSLRRARRRPPPSRNPSRVVASPELDT